jgi:hypothetical protein
MQYQDLYPSDNNPCIVNGGDYNVSISSARMHCQKQVLTDEELALITFDEIIHSYTRDERNYQ